MLKANEPEVPQDEREEAKRRARRYFHLAYRYTSDHYPVAIVIVCGLAGSGKSTIAGIVGARTGYQLLDSDVVRKQLAGSIGNRAGDGDALLLAAGEFTRAMIEALAQT